MKINLSGRDVYLLRRALSFWRESENVLKSADPAIAPAMIELQVRIERAEERQNGPYEHDVTANDFDWDLPSVKN
jgi:hypothetical protein